jgi:hypothetical protein
LDLTKYRAGELAERLTELISVPKVFGKLAKATVVVGLLVVLVCVLVFVDSGITLTSWLLVGGYALIAGALLGFLLGVLHIISTSLRTIGAVLLLMLDITGKAATDYEQLQTGEARLPTGGELFEQVYEDVVLPVIEKSVAGALGILGTPLLGVYRWTIGPAVRYVVKRVGRARLTANEERLVEAGTVTGLASISAYSERIKRFTSAASDVIAKIGSTMRIGLMLPLYFIFVTALVLAILPILVARYFVAG